MGQKRKGPLLSLQVALPSNETVGIDVEASDTVTEVKAMVASITEFRTQSFILTFDEEEVGGDNDGRLVGQLPFEDQSTLQVVLSGKEAALMRLADMGHSSLTFSSFLSSVNDTSEEADARYSMLLSLMVKAELFGNKQQVQQMIIKAAKKDLPLCAEEALKVCLEVNDLKDENGLTPLHHVAAYESHRVAVVLLRYGCDVDARDSHNRTPLHVAAGHRMGLSIATVLLAHNADPNVQDRDGRTSLHLAAKTNDAVITLLLHHNASVDAVDCSGKTALHYALASHNGFSRVSLLLQNNADVNARDTQGRNALHHVSTAARTGITEITSLLLRNNADVHARDNGGMMADNNTWPTGRTPLHVAATSYSGGGPMVPRAFQNLLERLVSEIVTLLLENNSDACTTDDHGRTPLHHASTVAVVKLLLRHKANINAKDCNGMTPLHSFASYPSKVSVAEYLLQNNADIYARDSHNRTPLDLAEEEASESAALWEKNTMKDLVALLQGHYEKAKTTDS